MPLNKKRDADIASLYNFYNSEIELPKFEIY
jgi:hypothetical protein